MIHREAARTPEPEGEGAGAAVAESLRSKRMAGLTRLSPQERKIVRFREGVGGAVMISAFAAFFLSVLLDAFTPFLPAVKITLGLVGGGAVLGIMLRTGKNWLGYAVLAALFSLVALLPASLSVRAAFLFGSLGIWFLAVGVRKGWLVRTAELDQLEQIEAEAAKTGREARAR